ncbi:transposase [Trichonephila clavipes]|nr:transposase [Trichonephila clavipes]
MHPPYSPDLAPDDYHPFLALQYFLSDKKLESREDCENRLPEFFADKGQDFNERGNMKPPLKCQQIIQQNGAVDTRRYPRAENRIWSDQEDPEERGSKDRVARTCGPYSDSFNDTSRRRRSNCSTNNFQTPNRSKS